MPRKILLTLPLLLTLASPALADTDQALLEKCDGMTRAGMIDPKLKDGVIGGFPEKRCAKEAELAKGKEESARLDAELAKGKEESARLDDDYKKMIQILAMLRPAEAKSYLAEEILKLENQIAQAKATNSTSKVKSYEHRLETLRTEQQKLK